MRACLASERGGGIRQSCDGRRGVPCGHVLVWGCLWEIRESIYGRRGVLVAMHGRSRMTIDPRIPTMPGRGAPTGQTLLCFAKREAP